MAELFEVDPISGIRTELSWNEHDQTMTVNRIADVEPVLDWTKAVQAEVGMNRKDIQKGWWLYAKLPPIVILQMRAKGINVFDSNDHGRMFAEINANYATLKCTTGVERGNPEKIHG